MKRALVVALFAAVAAAYSCSPSTNESQYEYRYDGCAPGGRVCPNDDTILCALDSIVRQHNACANDSDCVLSEVQNKCVAVLTCDGPPAIGRDQKAAFEAAFNAEFDKYCAAPSCTSLGACAPGPRRNVVVCLEGQCLRAFKPLDAGFADAGEFIPFDAGTPDGGVADGGADAGAADASTDVDAGSNVDAGEADAGDGGP